MGSGCSANVLAGVHQRCCRLADVSAVVAAVISDDDHAVRSPQRRLQVRLAAQPMPVVGKLGHVGIGSW